MNLLDEYALSQWAFHECRKGNDTKEMRKLIINDFWIYKYCKDIEDKEEMWRKIKHPYWAEWYCTDVKSRPEVRQYFEVGLNRIKSKLFG